MEIKFNDVTYIYNNSRVGILNINVELKEKKIYGVCGISGSGKTTMLELIDVLIQPTEGSLKIGSKIVSKDKIKNINSLREKIGLVFQFPMEQIFNNTVEKEIEFGIENFNKKVENISKHTKDALTMVGLNESYLKRNPQTLSSGELRKVAIASVLAYNPKVILLDEPIVGLDNKSKENLIRIIRMLKDRYNKTIIIVSNDTDTLHKICDDIIILNKGEVALIGTKYEVFTSDIEKYGLKKPKIIEFEQLVHKEKGIKMLYRDDINDLMKDVYRHVK